MICLACIDCSGRHCKPPKFVPVATSFDMQAEARLAYTSWSASLQRMTFLWCTALVACSNALHKCHRFDIAAAVLRTIHAQKATCFFIKWWTDISCFHHMLLSCRLLVHSALLDTLRRGSKALGGLATFQMWVHEEFMNSCFEFLFYAYMYIATLQLAL